MKRKQFSNEEIARILTVAGQKADVVQVLVDSVPAGEARLATGPAADGPKLIDLSRFVKPGSANEITVVSKDGKLNAQVQASAEWYQPWAARRESPHFKLDVQYSSATATVNDVITCDVNVIRPAYRHYGMMLVEVGLPPGAEVDRSSLEAVLNDSYSVNSYEVAPDRVTFYVWPTKEQTSFDFNFRPRFPMRAKSEPSSVSDYYNPDARLVLPPQDFVVKEAVQ